MCGLPGGFATLRSRSREPKAEQTSRSQCKFGDFATLDHDPIGLLYCTGKSVKVSIAIALRIEGWTDCVPEYVKYWYLRVATAVGTLDLV